MGMNQHILTALASPIVLACIWHWDGSLFSYHPIAMALGFMGFTLPAVLSSAERYGAQR